MGADLGPRQMREMGPRRGGPRGHVILEFEPVIGNRLQADAHRAFFLSALFTAAFLVVTALLWRLLRQREREEAHAEQERRFAMLGEMSAVLAHEIRNPLASLKGHAQLLSEQLAADSPQKRKADRVVSEAERIEALSASLLDLVRVGSVERQGVNPAELVADAADSINARVQVDASKAPQSWPLDRLRMQQVLNNLIHNAVQASPAEEPVSVCISADTKVLVFSVRDHGKGIPAGEEDRIFEAFHTTRTRGVGLGLAIARRIVELHGGEISAANHADGGAIFTVSIPRAA
jgi:two-component system sensor histidine kinase HydH